MKVLLINGSPKANGNTKAALDLMGEVFAQEPPSALILRSPGSGFG